MNGIDQKFEDLRKKLLEVGIDITENPLYRYVFDQAIAFALKQQTQKPLLTSTNKVTTLQLSTQPKEKTMQFYEDEQVPFPSFFLLNEQSVLSQSDLQRLQFVLRTILNSISNSRYDLARNASQLYTLCDPAKPETEQFFEMLNNVRESQRQSKKFYKQLAAIQNKLKKLQKSH